MSDQSHDPNPSRDPNAYLAPVVGGGLGMLLIYAIIFIVLYKYFYK
jgi:hypothetical protein